MLQLADSKKNSDVEEAAAAAAKAQSLMEKHRIKQAMLNTKVDNSINWKLLIDNGRPENWKIYLVNILAKNNGCYIVKSEEYNKDNYLYIVGESQDIDTIQELYGYLVKELIRLCLANILTIKQLYGEYPDSKYNKSFYLGAITTIEMKLSEANSQTRAKEVNNAKDPSEKIKIINVLSKLDNRIQNAKEWINNNLKAKFEKTSVNDINSSGYQAGKKAAKSLDLNPNRPKLDVEKQK